MRIVVFGAGALGSLVGGLLTRKHEVTMIAREPHVRAIEESGLVVSGLVEAVFVPRAQVDIRNVGSPDLIIVTVKAYDTQEALELIEPLVGGGTIVLSLQNGLNNASLLTAKYPQNVVVGVTSMGATRVGPGRVFYAGQGPTMFGSAGAPPEMVQAVCAAFNCVGLDSEVSEDIAADVWLKAIVNASINPLTAIMRCKNGRVMQDQDLMAVAKAACREATEVARAMDVHLPADDPFEVVTSVLKRTAENKSSMLQDVERRNRTEIDEISGEIVLRGEGKGLRCPVNRTLWHLTTSLTQYR
jgi:2-dehydropantoate 2-reductase